MDARFAGNCPGHAQTRAKQVAQCPDVLAAGDVLVTIEGLEGVLAHHRRAQSARDVLGARVSATTLTASLELRDATEPA